MMKTDIILCGVGGQGILSIATVLGQAATLAGIFLKQSEVHGMSQRGGDVHSDLRLGTEPICSDLIPRGGADLLISMEPMEVLRYLPWLGRDSVVVSSSKPFINIDGYPSEPELSKALEVLPHLQSADIEKIAQEAGSPRGSNMVLLGMAAKHIGVLDEAVIRKAIENVFASKGAATVEANCRCFELGLSL